ncbi:MAG: response regulator [Bacteroidetes bacterium]|nr:response regulator [Bacteroidota bacterium]
MELSIMMKEDKGTIVNTNLPKSALKILIVEDNPVDADLLHRELKKSGISFTAEFVMTREDYEYQLDHFLPDLILSDYSLPTFDGLSAFRIKQSKYPLIPFIIISGSIGEENAVELIKKGVTDYALKDKMYSVIPKIQRALEEVEMRKNTKESERILKLQNEQLFEIAFMQSHQVRRPIASLQGLLSMMNYEKLTDPINLEVFSRLKVVANEFDAVIHTIVTKTKAIEKLGSEYTSK